MAQVDIANGSLVVSVTGVDKLLALKSRLEVPLEHVAGEELRPEAARRWWHGFRLPGTNIPGVVTAGSFYHSGEWVFWDVHDPDKTVAIQLRDEHYPSGDPGGRPGSHGCGAQVGDAATRTAGIAAVRRDAPDTNGGLTPARVVVATAQT